MKLLRTFLLASALTLVLAPTAGAVKASTSAQLGDLVSNFTIDTANNKAGGSGVFKMDTDHLLTTGAKPPPSLSLFVTTPKGTTLNANIAETCDFDVLTNTGSCPSNAKLGSGTGILDVRTGGLDQLHGTFVIYKVANSNCSGLASGVKMCVAAHATEPVTGAVVNILLAVNMSGGGVKLNVPSYALPDVLGIRSILTQGNFVINKTKTVKVKGKKKKLYLLTNPSKCKKTWTYTDTRNYEGVGEITNTLQLPCKK